MSIKVKATSPCFKFINATSEAQMEKIREEVEELAEAWAAFEKERTEENLLTLFMELVDVKVCLNTAKAIIQWSVKKDNYCALLLDPLLIYDHAKKEVFYKNARRGYYWRTKNK